MDATHAKGARSREKMRWRRGGKGAHTGRDRGKAHTGRDRGKARAQEIAVYPAWARRKPLQHQFREVGTEERGEERRVLAGLEIRQGVAGIRRRELESGARPLHQPLPLPRLTSAATPRIHSLQSEFHPSADWSYRLQIVAVFLCSTSSRGSPLLPLLPPPADMHSHDSPLQLCHRFMYVFSPLLPLLLFFSSPSSSALLLSTHALLCFLVLMLCSSLLFVVLRRNR